MISINVIKQLIIENLKKGNQSMDWLVYKPMEHVIQFLLIYLIIPMFGPWIASKVSNLITTFVSYMPSIVLLSGLGAIIKFTYN